MAITDGISPDPGGTASREARAERYFTADLNGQCAWYSGRASTLKGRSQAFGLGVIIAGSATAFFSVLGNHPAVPVLIAFLGAAIAVLEGWRRISRYDEVWTSYRVAAERMKRERRLYVNGADKYRQSADEDDAFLDFVEAIEGIMAEEQQIYWANQGKRPVQAGLPAVKEGGATPA
jgi:hypothetical protein